MKKVITLLLALVAGAVFAEFKAGFARVDATPPLGIPIVGYFHHRVADGVLDPLYIDCVAVSDGTNNALIYCVDDLHLTNPFMAKAFPAITEATGIKRSLFSISDSCRYVTTAVVNLFFGFQLAHFVVGFHHFSRFDEYGLSCSRLIVHDTIDAALHRGSYRQH